MVYLRIMGFMTMAFIIYLLMMIGILNVAIECKPWFNTKDSGCITVEQFFRSK